MAKRITPIYDRVHLFCGVINSTANFIENLLTFEASVSSSEIIHVSKGILKLGFIYLCKPTKFIIIFEAKGICFIEKGHSSIIVFLGAFFATEKVCTNCLSRVNKHGIVLICIGSFNYLLR